MTEFCKEYNIKHILCAIACPRSNGQVERFNDTILNAMSAAVGEDQDAWESKIIEVQSGINGTINATTGTTPSELLYGYRPRLKFDVVLNNNQADRQGKLKCARDQAVANINKSEQRMKQRYDKNRLDAISYNVEDKVLVRRTPLVKGLTSGKLVQKYMGPVVVTHVLGQWRNYRVAGLAKCHGPRPKRPRAQK
ncbi:uncharacterized protein K02A2.6-like [Anoplophora glabripennis]|uniref:uncharacterized protein K02A2.6-like n=1 Tax=Anoplophora glabripennis TaxID=217634 RepID=UPI000C787C06|nr:uncharacterized protein K02A2.6-like [Anoplophora glabripennis]